MKDSLEVLVAAMDSIPYRDAFASLPAKLPLLYKNEYGARFAWWNDTLAFRPSGAYADAIPYQLENDSLFVSLLLLCLMAMMWLISRNPKMLKRWFHGVLNNKTEGEVVPLSDKSREERCSLYFLIQTTMMLTLLFWTHSCLMADEGPKRMLHLLPYWAAFSAAYMVVKYLLYRIVNWTFFDKATRSRWKVTATFLYSIEGVVFFVYLWYVLLSPSREMGSWGLFVFLFVKMVLFYKAFSIFFARFQGILHFIVYLCALEIMPVLFLWKGWTIMNETIL